MGRRVALAVGLLVTAFLPPATGVADNPGDPIDGGCTIGLSATPGSHGTRFTSRCDFEQTSIRLNPDAVIDSVSPTLRLSKGADRGDGVSCRQSDGIASCSGRAGAGTRISGRLITGARACDVSTKVRIIGGLDCDPGAVCPDLAFVVRKRIGQPRGC